MRTAPRQRLTAPLCPLGGPLRISFSVSRFAFMRDSLKAAIWSSVFLFKTLLCLPDFIPSESHQAREREPADSKCENDSRHDDFTPVTFRLMEPAAVRILCARALSSAQYLVDKNTMADCPYLPVLYAARTLNPFNSRSFFISRPFMPLSLQFCSPADRLDFS